jgi:hypothetical protein
MPETIDRIQEARCADRIATAKVRGSATATAAAASAAVAPICCPMASETGRRSL